MSVVGLESEGRAAITTLLELPLDMVVESLTNPRTYFDAASLAELADSIEKHGLLQRIVVRPHPTSEGLYELIAGARRLRAFRIAAARQGELGSGDPSHCIPVEVREASDAEARVLQAIENDQRVDVTPVERARGYRSMIDSGLYGSGQEARERVALELGVSPSTVYQRLQLLKGIPEAQDECAAGVLSENHLKELARLPETAQAEALSVLLYAPDFSGGKVVRGARREEVMSVRQLKVWIGQTFNDLGRAPFPTNDLMLLPQAGSCIDCSKRTGFERELSGSEHDVCLDGECWAAKVAAAKPAATAGSTPRSDGATDESLIPPDDSPQSHGGTEAEPIAPPELAVSVAVAIEWCDRNCCATILPKDGKPGHAKVSTVAGAEYVCTMSSLGQESAQAWLYGVVPADQYRGPEYSGRGYPGIVFRKGSTLYAVTDERVVLLGRKPVVEEPEVAAMPPFAGEPPAPLPAYVRLNAVCREISEIDTQMEDLSARRHELVIERDRLQGEEAEASTPIVPDDGLGEIVNVTAAIESGAADAAEKAAASLPHSKVFALRPYQVITVGPERHGPFIVLGVTGPALFTPKGRKAIQCYTIGYCWRKPNSLTLSTPTTKAGVYADKAGIHWGSDGDLVEVQGLDQADDVRALVEAGS